MTHDIPPPRVVFIVALVVEGALAVLALGIGWAVGHDPLGTLQPSLSALAWGAAATAPMAAMLVWAHRATWGGLQQLKRLVEDEVVPLFARMHVAQLGLVSLVAGVGEELLFRGVLQAGLAEWLGPPAGGWIALAVAAVAFGLAHYVIRAYAVLATGVGVYLGVLFVVTGSLLAPVVTHALYDFVALLYLVRWTARDAGPPLDHIPGVSPEDPPHR